MATVTPHTLRIHATRDLLAVATSIVLVATTGSLFLSLHWSLQPCVLCWYQRLLIYPLIPILGFAIYDDRPGVCRHLLLFGGSGLAISTYHSWLQLGDATQVCSVGSGCAAVQYRVAPLGLTTPNLALIAFSALFVIGGVLWHHSTAT